MSSRQKTIARPAGRKTKPHRRGHAQAGKRSTRKAAPSVPPAHSEPEPVAAAVEPEQIVSPPESRPVASVQPESAVGEAGAEPQSGTEDHYWELLAFELGGEEYALELKHIKEIIRWMEVTRVPRIHPAIKGIISLRGVVMPVFDLRTLLGLTESPPTRQSRIIVVSLESGTLGLVADRVSEVLRLPVSQIEPASPLMGEEAAEHLLGIGRNRGHPVMLLDLEKTIRIEEVAQVSRET
jgi:purine-binding chemotaxis protein CheW